MEADGLVVPGVGAFAACMEGLRAVRVPRSSADGWPAAAPCSAICVGTRCSSTAASSTATRRQAAASGQGVVERLNATVLPHIGWNTVEVAGRQRHVRGRRAGAVLLRALVRRAALGARRHPPHEAAAGHLDGYQDDRFVAAVENGPLWATQFHPEKSGDAGAVLLSNWVQQR